MPSYPQGANSQTHQPIPPYVSPNGIYYTPPPPGAYPGSSKIKRFTTCMS